MNIYKKVYEARPVPIDGSNFDKLHKDFCMSASKTILGIFSDRDFIDVLVKALEFTVRYGNHPNAYDLFQSVVFPGVKNTPLSLVNGTNIIMLNYIIASAPTKKFDGSLKKTNIAIGFVHPEFLSEIGGFYINDVIAIPIVLDSVGQMVKYVKSDTVRSILYHELVHAHDTFTVKERDIGGDNYYNSMVELKAYLSQICEEERQRIEKEISESLEEEPSTLTKRIVKDILMKNKRFLLINRSLNEKSRKYFYKGFVTFVEDLIEKNLSKEIPAEEEQDKLDLV